VSTNAEPFTTEPMLATFGSIESSIFGLQQNRTVVASGWNDFGECDVSSWQNIVAIAAGWRHTIGLKNDGTVIASGENHLGNPCDVGEWQGIIDNVVLGLLRAFRAWQDGQREGSPTGRKATVSLPLHTVGRCTRIPSRSGSLNLSSGRAYPKVQRRRRHQKHCRRQRKKGTI